MKKSLFAILAILSFLSERVEARIFTVSSTGVDSGLANNQPLHSGRIRFNVHFNTSFYNNGSYHNVSFVSVDASKGLPYVNISGISNLSNSGQYAPRAIFAGIDSSCISFDYNIQPGDFAATLSLSGAIILNGAIITDSDGEIMSDGSRLSNSNYGVSINTLGFAGNTNVINAAADLSVKGVTSTYCLYSGGNLANQARFLVSAYGDDDTSIEISDQLGANAVLNTRLGNLFVATMPEYGVLVLNVTPLVETTNGVTIRVSPTAASGATFADCLISFDNIKSSSSSSGEEVSDDDSNTSSNSVCRCSHESLSLSVTNIVLHYVTQSLPSNAVIPPMESGIVNVVTEVGAGSAVAISSDWAAQYPGFTEKFGNDFGAAITAQTGKRDGSGNPMFVWQDFVAGTDPTDSNDVFTASITFDATTGEPVVSWSPELSAAEAAKRSYTTYGKVRLTDPDWTPIDGDEADYNFFKVEVKMK